MGLRWAPSIPDLQTQPVGLQKSLGFLQLFSGRCTQQAGHVCGVKGAPRHILSRGVAQIHRNTGDGTADVHKPFPFKRCCAGG